MLVYLHFSCPFEEIGRGVLTLLTQHISVSALKMYNQHETANEVMIKILISTSIKLVEANIVFHI